jgi:hypothetical protein
MIFQILELHWRLKNATRLSHSHHSRPSALQQRDHHHRQRGADSEPATCVMPCITCTVTRPLRPSLTITAVQPTLRPACLPFSKIPSVVHIKRTDHQTCLAPLRIPCNRHAPHSSSAPHISSTPNTFCRAANGARGSSRISTTACAATRSGKSGCGSNSIASARIPRLTSWSARAPTRIPIPKKGAKCRSSRCTPGLSSAFAIP